MKKTFLIFFAIIDFCLITTAQIDLCLPVATAKGGAVTATVTDWEAIGINPSNLGWKENHKFSLSILNVGVSAQSSALDYPTFKNIIFHPSDTFSMAEKQRYAQVLANPNGLNLYGDINWLAFSLNIPKIGGFAMNLRDRVTAHLTLSPTAADILFNGLNSKEYTVDSSQTLASKISNELAGSNFSFYHYRELNLDYGRMLFQLGGSGPSVSSFDVLSSDKKGEAADEDDAFKVYGGIGLKYLWGLADVYANITPGGLTAHSSITSSYAINYGNIPNFTPSSAANLFNNTGSGVAADIGISAVYKKWRFGVSATDLGSIYWQHNTLTAIDTNMPRLASNNFGINSFGSSSDFSLANNSIMNFRPGPDYSVALPSKLRFGAAFEATNRITISSDIVFPLNDVLGNIQFPFYAAAAQFQIIKYVYVSTGFCGNQTYGFEMPLGICLGLKNYIQFYLATSDILTYLVKNNNPNISAAFGLLRFNL